MVFEQTKGHVDIFTAIDTNLEHKKTGIPNDPKLCGGLHKTLELKVELTMELCVGTLDMADELANGAEGIYKGHNIIHNKTTIWIHFFNKNIGIHTRYNHHNFRTKEILREWTPINTTTQEFQIEKNLMNKDTISTPTNSSAHDT